MFDEPKVWPLTIGEKILRLFRNEFPRVHDVNVHPVWIVGELMEFGGDFNKYVTARKLQKEEGILFRHCLRMILLLGRDGERTADRIDRGNLGGSAGRTGRQADRDLSGDRSTEHRRSAGTTGQ